MNDVVGVFSHLLHESRDAFHANKPGRRIFDHRPKVSGPTVFFYDQELELEVGEKLASALNVVGLDAGEENRDGQRLVTIDRQPNEMIVSRGVGIGNFAPCEFGWERDLLALGKADHSVKFLSELRILPGKDMKQLMADEPLEIFLALAELARREHDGRGSRVSRVAFLRSRGLDQLNNRRQGKSQLAQERWKGLEGSLHGLRLVGGPLRDVLSDKGQKFSFRNGLVGLHSGRAVKQTQTLDEFIPGGENPPAFTLRGEMHLGAAEWDVGRGNAGRETDAGKGCEKTDVHKVGKILLTLPARGAGEHWR